MEDESLDNKITSVRDAKIYLAYWKDEVTEVASSVSLEKYKNIVKTLASHPSACKKMCEITTNNLITELHQDVEYMWEESKLMEKYNEITKLIEDSKEDNKTKWRPVAGDCEDNLLAYRIYNLKEQKKKLEEIINTTEQELSIKKSQLEAERSSIFNSIKNMKAIENTLELYNSNFNDFQKTYLKHKT